MGEREIYKSDVGVVRSSKRARRKMRDVSRQIEMGQHRAIRFWIILKMFSCKTMERGHFPRRDSDTSATSFLLSNEYLNIWCEELRILIIHILLVSFLTRIFSIILSFFICFYFSLISFYLYFILNIFVHFLLLLLKFISSFTFVYLIFFF